MSDVAPRLLVALALSLPGCDKEEEKPETKAKPEAAGDSEGTPEKSPLLPEPLTRAKHKLRFYGTANEHMSFALPKLSKLHALAGAIEIPEWSLPGEGAPRLTRDDNLRTSWTCTPTKEDSCAIGIHFPEPADVAGLRLYSAAPEGGGPHARPSVVRMHTHEGWTEVRVPDDDRPWHVLLGEPIPSRNFTLEIIEMHGDGPMHLAEFEVYGKTGTPRPPLNLDLSKRVITFDSSPWKSKARIHNARASFVEQVDVDGRLQRMLPGTAVYGKQGDRMLLIENTSWASCGEHRGTYQLYDRETRVSVPLGDFGAFGTSAFRHKEGLGMALGILGLDDGTMQAVLLDGDDFERRAYNRLEQRPPRELLEAWGFETEALSRASTTTLADTKGCSAAKESQLELLKPHLPRRAKVVADQWHQCDLGGGTFMLMSTGGECGRDWRLAALDSEGELLGMDSGKENGMHARLRRVDAETMLVELWGSKDGPRMYKVDIDGPRKVGKATAFSLRPPASCRKKCETSFDDLRNAED